MLFSATIVNDNTPWPVMRDLVTAADNGSWYCIWNYDHLMPPLAWLLPHLADNMDDFENGDTYEAWSLLAAWAAITQRVRIGCMVTAVPYRNPALLAKMAVTVDHVSNGRLELGLGVGWHNRETEAYGLPLGTISERLERFAEALQVLRNLLTPGRWHDYTGQHYQLKNAPFAPQPLQPKLPIVIGGGGEKKTLRLVAMHADAYNFFGNQLGTLPLYVHKNRVLDEHCIAIGRDPKTIRRSVCLYATIVPDDAKAKAVRDRIGQHLPPSERENLLIGSPSRIVDGVGEFAHLGVAEVVFCSVLQRAESFQEFDESVLRVLRSSGVR
jgi:alkanesulfonate monooxygenase SsuD/methylene tetrahydromethanopterin reductase-like flavin-dependent oxidoreductase (luciferase family)